ncbi:MAG TPA: signal peptidase I [Nocardioidaceae bacterium]|nr:signal peptidase I [Nocardioidaceae bacterium]
MGSADARQRGRRSRSRRGLKLWQETIVLVALAILVSVVVKAFFVQMFYVPSGSMKPLFAVNDRILVEKISYWSGDVQRGDVVVFSDPGHWLGVAPDVEGVHKLLSLVGLYPSGGHLVKRVVGVGGDHVVCCDDRGRLTVNGEPVAESDYLAEGTAPSEEKFDVRVPADSLWVMGDNRSNSQDSRAHQRLPNGGAVPVDDVVGKVWAIVWPWDRTQILDDPDLQAG